MDTGETPNVGQEDPIGNVFISHSHVNYEEKNSFFLHLNLRCKTVSLNINQQIPFLFSIYRL